jgi:hypothetical protein
MWKPSKLTSISWIKVALQIAKDKKSYCNYKIQYHPLRIKFQQLSFIKTWLTWVISTNSFRSVKVLRIYSQMIPARIAQNLILEMELTKFHLNRVMLNQEFKIDSLKQNRKLKSKMKELMHIPSTQTRRIKFKKKAWKGHLIKKVL